MISQTDMPEGFSRIADCKHIHAFAEGEQVVAMTQWRERLFVATNLKVYEVRENVLVPLRLISVDTLGAAHG